MLVLTRKVGSGIVLDDGNGTRIRVLVTMIDDNRVRLGIEAPPHVNIVREELLPTSCDKCTRPAGADGTRTAHVVMCKSCADKDRMSFEKEFGRDIGGEGG